MYPLLTSTFRLGRFQLKNRIVLTAHDTGHARRGLPSPEMIAYYQARAKGGVGMIVLQASGVHESARYWPKLMMAHEDSCVSAYAALVAPLKAHDTVVVGQLFHPGRVHHGKTAEGMLPVPLAPCAVAMEAGALVPQAMSVAFIKELIAAYAAAAGRMMAAGVDGVEITGAHGYLPGQFLLPEINKRDDAYGGNFDNRLRFIRETLAAVRAEIGGDALLGLRLTVRRDDIPDDSEPDFGAICQALEADGALDYLSLAFGDESGHAGATHMIPPMAMPTAYVAEVIKAVRQTTRLPVIASGRVNDLGAAEAMLESGVADLCGCTRAMIADPEFAGKAMEGRHDDVRACIGCNQACVGHLEEGYSISCIQYPESGRELRQWVASPQSQTVMVIGGGPAGMKAAITAAQRGHDVVLYEADKHLGGQIRLAQEIPGRGEFGGLSTNLEHELKLTNVRVVKGSRVTGDLLRELNPQIVIYAAGARPAEFNLPGGGDGTMIDAWQVLSGNVPSGANILVFDWRADWIGPGVAEYLAKRGHYVRLAVNASRVGDHIQTYVRDLTAARLHRLGIHVTSYARLYGFDQSTAYCTHSISGEPMTFAEVDTIVIGGFHRAVHSLEGALASFPGRVFRIGDCVAPRTAEEAVYEGWQAGLSI